MAKKIDKPTDTDMHLGMQLRQLREAKGFSQAEVGRYVGVSRQAVSMWESGINQPSPRRMNEVLVMLGARSAARAVAVEAMKPNVRERFRAATDIPFFRTRPSELIAGCFNFDTPIIGFLPAPDSLPAHKDVVCFLMHDTSMLPWRSEGEPVYVDQKRSPKIGDHALVRLGEPGKTSPKTSIPPDDVSFTFTVRLLTGLGPDSIRLKAYLPGTEEVLPLTQVGSIARILEWSELFGPLAKVWQSSTFD